MNARLSLLVPLLCLFLGSLPMAAPAADSQAMQADRQLLPPNLRQYAAHNGRYRLKIETLDGWHTAHPRAELRTRDGRLRWRQTLPHELGPRRALVSDQGEVVLLDEWINVVSSRALMVIAADGKVRSHHGAEEIFSLLAVPRQRITEYARLGTWLATEPEFSRDGRAVLLQAAGRRLSLNLADGKLSLLD